MKYRPKYGQVSCVSSPKLVVFNHIDVQCLAAARMQAVRLRGEGGQDIYC